MFEQNVTLTVGKEVYSMAKFCEVCSKGVMSGNLVSHSNRKTKRGWAPNIQSVHVVVDGTTRKMNVCTRCLRSGKVERSV